jgi:hypothetical protein
MSIPFSGYAEDGDWHGSAEEWRYKIREYRKLHPDASNEEIATALSCTLDCVEVYGQCE